MPKDTNKPFETLPTDDNNISIQAGNSFTTQDNSETPKTSPLSFSSAEIMIAIPDRAVEIILAPNKDLRVSEIEGMARYDIVAADTKEIFPCANIDSIYIKKDSLDGVVAFRFILV